MTFLLFHPVGYCLAKELSHWIRSLSIYASFFQEQLIFLGKFAAPNFIRIRITRREALFVELTNLIFLPISLGRDVGHARRN